MGDVIGQPVLVAFDNASAHSLGIIIYLWTLGYAALLFVFFGGEPKRGISYGANTCHPLHTKNKKKPQTNFIMLPFTHIQDF